MTPSLASSIILLNFMISVIYFSDKHSDKSSTIASKRLLDMAGVTYQQFVPRMKKLTIDFDIINEQGGRLK